MKSTAESCSRQLRAWADHLQNTPIRGQRHLNDAARAEFDGNRRREAFLAKMQSIRDRGKEDRESEI